MSIGHLAELIGVSKSSIYEFENLEKRISVDSVLKIEKELDIGITKPIYIIKVGSKRKVKLSMNALLKLQDLILKKRFWVI